MVPVVVRGGRITSSSSIVSHMMCVIGRNRLLLGLMIPIQVRVVRVFRHALVEYLFLLCRGSILWILLFVTIGPTVLSRVVGGSIGGWVGVRPMVRGMPCSLAFAVGGRCTLLL